MERIYYDTYENRIRVTVWAEQRSDGSVRIHKYTRGVYIDDIFGTDEDETYIVIGGKDLQKAFSSSGARTVKDFFVSFDGIARSRDGYEIIKSWLEKSGVIFTEESV